jgi:hypothetical protein
MKYREMVLICSVGRKLRAGDGREKEKERGRVKESESERERKRENNRYVGWELPADLTRPTPFASKHVFFLHMEVMT